MPHLFSWFLCCLFLFCNYYCLPLKSYTNRDGKSNWRNFHCNWTNWMEMIVPGRTFFFKSIQFEAFQMMSELTRFSFFLVGFVIGVFALTIGHRLLEIHIFSDIFAWLQHRSKYFASLWSFAFIYSRSYFAKQIIKNITQRIYAYTVYEIAHWCCNSTAVTIFTHFWFT